MHTIRTVKVGCGACGGNKELDMVRSWELPEVSDDEISAAEQSIAHAFETRTVDHLNVFGLGEISLAVGWPTQRPSAVLKRQAPGRPDEVRAEVERTRRYHSALAAAGLSLLPTEVRTVPTAAGDDVLYLVQPLVEREHLVEHILATETAPSAAHPILISLREAAKRIVREDVDGGLSLDCQVTNFAWDGEQVVSLDTTPALIWSADSGPMYDMGAYTTAVPAVMRPVIRSTLRTTGDYYRVLRLVLEMSAIFLLRIDQERWVDPAIACFNEVLDEPLDRTHIDRRFVQIRRDMPILKAACRAQRFWISTIRRQRYEFFITNSFTGEVY